MNNDLEKQRQEFIIKFGFEPTKEELLTYIKNNVEMNDGNFDNKKNVLKDSESTTGILLLIWFVSSIITLMYFSSIERTIELMLVFGHYFLVFGIMAFLSSKNVENMNLLFVLGIVFLFSVLLFPGEIHINIDPDRFVFLILGLIFFVTGLVFFSKVIKAKILKGKFVKIDAYVSDYIGDDDMKACVFEYNFNEQIYKVTDNVYTSGRLPRIGTIKKIRVNPDKPDEIVFQTMSGYSLILAIPFTLIGGVFIIVALIA